MSLKILIIAILLLMFIFQYQQYAFLEQMNAKFGELTLSDIEHDYIRSCIIFSFAEFQRFFYSDTFQRSLSFFSYSCVFQNNQLIPGKRFACGSIHGMPLIRSTLLQVLQSRNIHDIRQKNMDYVGIGWEQTEQKQTFRVYMRYHNYTELDEYWKLDKNSSKKTFIPQGLVAVTYPNDGNNIIEYKLYRYTKDGEAWLFSSTRPEPIHQRNCGLTKEIAELEIVREMNELGYHVDTWAREGDLLKIYWPKMPIWKLF